MMYRPMNVRGDGATDGSGFSTTPLARTRAPLSSMTSNAPLAARLLALHLDDRDDVAAGLGIGVDHLLQAGRLADHQIVDQQHRERLVADHVPSAPHGMAKPERQLLPGIGELSGGGQPLLQLVEQFALAAVAQRRLELEGQVEMVLDGTFGAPSDEIELLDAGRLGLFHRIMDQRLVDYRQHLLGHRLGRRQDPGAEPGHRKDGFAHGFWYDTLRYFHRQDQPSSSFEEPAGSGITYNAI
jgi:hypothetical protein